MRGVGAKNTSQWGGSEEGFAALNLSKTPTRWVGGKGKGKKGKEKRDKRERGGERERESEPEL